MQVFEINIIKNGSANISAAPQAGSSSNESRYYGEGGRSTERSTLLWRRGFGTAGNSAGSSIARGGRAGGFTEDEQIIMNIPCFDIPPELDEVLEIKCKNFRILQIQFEKRVELEHCNFLLEKLCFCETTKQCFAYANRDYEIFKLDSICLRGWDLYQFHDEFKRQNISSSWKITHLNKNYDLCPSYPPLFYIPSSISDLGILSSLFSSFSLSFSLSPLLFPLPPLPFPSFPFPFLPSPLASFLPSADK